MVIPGFNRPAKSELKWSGRQPAVIMEQQFSAHEVIPRKDSMIDSAQKTIEGFSCRSDNTVTRITMAFALGGALMDIGSHVLGSFISGAGISMLWGMWIPLCFITIPPIHYLCRRVQTLQKRMEDLESKLQDRHTASVAT